MKNYLKKFNIMFLMLLAIISIGTIQNGSVANAATTSWDSSSKSAYGVLSNGNLSFEANNHANFVKASNKVPVGKSYCEFNIDTDGTIEIGIVANNYILSDARYIDYSINSRNVRLWNGCKSKDFKVESYMPSLTKNDTLGMAIDQINGTISFYKNGVNCGIAYSDLNSLESPVYPAVSFDSVGKITANFGATPFKYNIPDGYVAYDTSNTQVSLINLNKSIDKLQVGQTDNLTATTTPSGSEVEWSSNDESIATVDSTGKVTAVKEGQAIITAQIKGSETKATCTVNITNVVLPPNPVSSITLDKSIMKLTMGDTQRLTAITSPSGLDVEWSSSDYSVVEIKQDGTINAKGSGTAIITARIKGTEISASCIVTVTKQSNTDIVNSSGGTTNSYGILNINTPSGFTQNNNNGGNNNSSNNSNNTNNSGNSGNNYSNNNNSNSNNNYYYYNNYYISFNTKA